MCYLGSMFYRIWYYLGRLGTVNYRYSYYMAKHEINSVPRIFKSVAFCIPRILTQTPKTEIDKYCGIPGQSIYLSCQGEV